MSNIRFSALIGLLEKSAGLFGPPTVKVPDSISQRISPYLRKLRLTPAKGVKRNELGASIDAATAAVNDPTKENVNTAVNSALDIARRGPISADAKYDGDNVSAKIDTGNAEFLQDDKKVSFNDPIQFSWSSPGGKKHNWTISDEDGKPLDVRAMTPEESKRIDERFAATAAHHATPRADLTPRTIAPDIGTIIDEVNNGALSDNDRYKMLYGALNGLDKDSLYALRNDPRLAERIPEDMRDDFNSLVSMSAHKPYRDAGMNYLQSEYMSLPDAYMHPELTDLVSENMDGPLATARDKALQDYLSKLRMGRSDRFYGGTPEELAYSAISSIRDAKLNDYRNKLYDKYFGSDAILRSGHLQGTSPESMIALMGLDKRSVPTRRRDVSTSLFGPKKYVDEIDNEAVNNMFRGWLDQQIFDSDEYAQAVAARRAVDEYNRRRAELESFYRKNPVAVRETGTMVG